MKIDKVTITGADNSIKPSDLIALSEKYPFVEWGILFSKNRVGTSRYPTIDWVKELLEAIGDKRVNLSAHLCGSYSSAMLHGVMKTGEIGISFGKFGRFQINLSADKLGSAPDEFYELIGKTLSEKNFIMQHKPVNVSLCDEIVKRKLYNVDFLFDSSGGKGDLAGSYNVPIEEFYSGYAGGLNPDNLQSELLKIEAVAADTTFWIDTESGVRSNDDNQFDLDKVVAFLETAKQYIVPPAVVRRTREEINQRKADWIDKDIDIYEGFEAHREELKKFVEETMRINEKADHLGLRNNIRLLKYIEGIESQIAKLHERIRKMGG